MNNETPPPDAPVALDAPDDPARKPRVALMGEFSAGKSTLSNLLLGADPLPVKVTATRLPPVWIAFGDDPAWREDLDGNRHKIDIDDLESVGLEETRLIRLFLKSDMLQLCDLIDMPGISDPNMASEVWRDVIGEADNVIWCSHATQAWRQSEAAVWDTLPETLRDKSLLLLTRFDKLLNERDRMRVLARVRRETQGLFSDMFPVSLIQALAAGDDQTMWDQSGAGPFVERLIDLLVNPQSVSGGSYETVVVARQDRRERASDVVAVPEPREAVETAPVRVMPSRVRATPGGQTPTRRPVRARKPQVDEPALAGMPGEG